MSKPVKPRRPAKAPRSATIDRWGILNPYGDVWTADTFNDPEAAERYIANFWKGTPGIDLGSFKVVRVRVRVSVPLGLRDLHHSNPVHA